MIRALRDGTSNLEKLAVWKEDVLPGMSIGVTASFGTVSFPENMYNMNRIVLKRCGVY
jgi:hypothetical protein